MNFKEWLNESTEFKYAFNAVFMAGSPGSGKSFLANKIFGFDFLHANSDKIQELMGQIDPRHPDFQNSMIKSQEINAKRTNGWAEVGYPLIIDITGRNASLTQEINRKLISLGYDTGMLYVHSDLEKALDRNQQRTRQADPEYLKTAWRDATNNIDAFKMLFNNKFYYLNNTNDANLDSREINRIVRIVVGNPYSIENPIGREKIRNKISNSPIKKERSWLQNVGVH